MQTGAHCGGCAFSGERQKQGEVEIVPCKRFPPTVFVFPTQVSKTPANPSGVAIGTQAYYPMVGAADWCGEYLAKGLAIPS